MCVQGEGGPTGDRQRRKCFFQNTEFFSLKYWETFPECPSLTLGCIRALILCINQQIQPQIRLLSHQISIPTPRPEVPLLGPCQPRKAALRQWVLSVLTRNLNVTFPKHSYHQHRQRR